MQDDRCPGSYVSHLECSRTGEQVPHDRLHGLSACGAPLLIQYDLDRMAAELDRDLICRRMADMWMWHEFLPLNTETEPVTLGEAITPLIPVCEGVLIKDEGRLPTGSFKARGMAIAVTMARHFGKTELAVPTAGNAGAAAAAYGAAAGMNVHVFTPEDTPKVTVQEIALHGAAIYQVDGLIDTCGKIVRAVTATEPGWHDLSTLAEPYRLEGKKTMGLELALQFGWSLPDVIYYPTGGGTGFIGMWKAFQELRHLGWIDGKLPRMVSVQTHGCNPIKLAFESGQDDVEVPFAPVTTMVPGVRVPKPLGGRLIIDVLRASGGHACAVSDEEVMQTQARVAAQKGISLCPEGAACLAAYEQDLAAQKVVRDETALIFNTATGFKWPMPEVTLSQASRELVSKYMAQIENQAVR